MARDQDNFEQCKLLLDKKAPIDVILLFLKSKGYSKGVSAAFLTKLGFGSFDAKVAVHESEVWKENYEMDSRFHDFLSKNDIVF